MADVSRSPLPFVRVNLVMLLANFSSAHCFSLPGASSALLLQSMRCQSPALAGRWLLVALLERCAVPGEAEALFLPCVDFLLESRIVNSC